MSFTVRRVVLVFHYNCPAADQECTFDSVACLRRRVTKRGVVETEPTLLPVAPTQYASSVRAVDMGVRVGEGSAGWERRLGVEWQRQNEGWNVR